MKLVTLLLMFFFFSAISGCEHYHHHDIVEGTPSRADTVLPHSQSHDQSHEPAKTEAAPGVFRR